jgi:hypothetical protein
MLSNIFIYKKYQNLWISISSNPLCSSGVWTNGKVCNNFRLQRRDFKIFNIPLKLSIFRMGKAHYPIPILLFESKISDQILQISTKWIIYCGDPPKYQTRIFQRTH